MSTEETLKSEERGRKIVEAYRAEKRGAQLAHEQDVSVLIANMERQCIGLDKLAIENLVEEHWRSSQSLRQEFLKKENAIGYFKRKAKF